MPYKVITAVATEPIDLPTAKLHLKVDADMTDDDDLIEALIPTARELAEQYANRAFAEQTLEAAFSEFPRCEDSIKLPLGPVDSVTWLKYTDAEGAEQAASTDLYYLSDYGAARDVFLNYGEVWPVTAYVPEAVRVRYVTGTATCPKSAISAMLLMIGYLYENRGDNTVTQSRNPSIEMDAGLIQPPAARALLDLVKVWG